MKIMKVDFIFAFLYFQFQPPILVNRFTCEICSHNTLGMIRDISVTRVPLPPLPANKTSTGSFWKIRSVYPENRWVHGHYKHENIFILYNDFCVFADQQAEVVIINARWTIWQNVRQLQEHATAERKNSTCTQSLRAHVLGAQEKIKNSERHFSKKELTNAFFNKEDECVHKSVWI